MVANNQRYNQRDEEERETNSAGQSGDISGHVVPGRTVTFASVVANA